MPKPATAPASQPRRSPALAVVWVSDGLIDAFREAMFTSTPLRRDHLPARGLNHLHCRFGGLDRLAAPHDQRTLPGERERSGASNALTDASDDADLS
jgi:hypothetical protein